MLWAFLGLVLSAQALPTYLTSENANDIVGATRFEASLMALAKIGMYELSITPFQLRELLAAVHPFQRYEESKENVVLMDAFPYVPVVEVPTHNATIILSNLVLNERVDTDLIKVEFDRGYQSIYFLDIAVNATFDWRVNNTHIGGSATVKIPHSWVHQNIETSCSHDLPSMLEWEGRVELVIAGVDILTACADRTLIDAFATALRSSADLKTYIGNAMQHQLAGFIGDLHWKAQAKMRDLCLQCRGIRYNSTLIVMAFRGDKSCLNMLPNFFWDGVFDENAKPAAAQAVVVPALKAGLIRQYRTKKSTEEVLETQGLPSTTAGFKQDLKPDQLLTPRVDPHQKFRRHLPEGFVEENDVAPWKAKIGQMWMNWNHPQNSTN